MLHPCSAAPGSGAWRAAGGCPGAAARPCSCTGSAPSSSPGRPRSATPPASCAQACGDGNPCRRPPPRQAYEILELFLELVAVRAPLVANSKEIPRDMVEALSSVLYAATR
jgi:hypothetical protein